jgi:enamine deaminase RidA (YjgF/YER057c/UK114 family)
MYGWSRRGRHYGSRKAKTGIDSARRERFATPTSCAPVFGRVHEERFPRDVAPPACISAEDSTKLGSTFIRNEEGIMEIEKKLKELGYELPNPPTPAANYIGCVRVGNLLFIGGNIGRINGALKYRGKVGASVTLEQAYEAARNCALNHLATIKAALGDLDKVERIVKVLSYVNVAPGFTDMPKVANGESDLLVQLWGERGQHTRAAVGVASLSQDAPVENEITVQAKD